MEFDILAKVVEKPTLAEVVGEVPSIGEEKVEEPRSESLIEAEVELEKVEEEKWGEVLSKVESVSSRLEEAWGAIEDLKKLFEDVANAVKGIEDKASSVSRVVEVVALWKCGRCRFFKDGTCTAWRLSEDFAKLVEEAFGPEAVVRDGDVIRLKVEKAFVIGAICPLFRAKA